MCITFEHLTLRQLGYLNSPNCSISLWDSVVFFPCTTLHIYVGVAPHSLHWHPCILHPPVHLTTRTIFFSFLAKSSSHTFIHLHILTYLLVAFAHPTSICLCTFPVYSFYSLSITSIYATSRFKFKARILHCNVLS